jgi:hypothetical protein
MSLTNVAMMGILLGFVFLVVGFLMEGPQVERETAWNKSKHIQKKARKHSVHVHHVHRHAA